MAHCILIYRDTSYCVIGPFDSQTAAEDWGHKHSFGPRGWIYGQRDWTIINLENPAAAPALYAPGDTTNIPELQ